MFCVLWVEITEKKFSSVSEIKFVTKKKKLGVNKRKTNSVSLDVAYMITHSTVDSLQDAHSKNLQTPYVILMRDFIHV